MSKLIICFLVFGFSVYISYLNNKKSIVNKDQATTRKEKSKRVNSVKIHELEKKLDEKFNIKATRSISSIKELEFLDIVEEKSRLKKILGNEPVANDIFNTLIAIEVEEKVDGAEDLKKELYEKAKSNSRESLKIIERAINSFGINQDSIDKMRLLDIAGHLEGVNDEVVELGEKVLMENIVEKRPDPSTAANQEELNKALSTTFEMIVPIMAHALAISKTSDDDIALEITIDGIEAQPDPFIYTRLADSHLQQFPGHEEEINRAIARVSDNEVTESKDDLTEGMDDVYEKSSNLNSESESSEYE